MINSTNLPIVINMMSKSHANSIDKAIVKDIASFVGVTLSPFDKALGRLNNLAKRCEICKLIYSMPTENSRFWAKKMTSHRNDLIISSKFHCTHPLCTETARKEFIISEKKLCMNTAWYPCPINESEDDIDYFNRIIFNIKK